MTRSGSSSGRPARCRFSAFKTQEVQQLNQQREQEQADQFKTWSKEQDDKFSKQFPEFNDPEKGPKVRASVQLVPDEGSRRSRGRASEALEQSALS
jgi:hypothetical protein